MSNLFFNKVAGAFLASALGLIVIGKISSAVIKPDVPEPKDFAYSLAIETEAAPVVVAEVAFPSPVWLGARDAVKGAKVYKKCKACHTIDNGGKDGIGPHLWNSVGRSIGGVAGFGYSDNMRSKGGAGVSWGYAELDEFLTKPKKYIPKTKMAFNGLKKQEDRAAVIEYLRLAADTPMAQLTIIEEEAEILETVIETVEDGVKDAVEPVLEGGGDQ